MKTKNETKLAPRLFSQAPGVTNQIIKHTTRVLAILILGLAAVLQAGEVKLTGPSLTVVTGGGAAGGATNAVAPPDTNSVVGKIQTDLAPVRTKIKAALDALKVATEQSTPAQHSAIVSNLAMEFRAVADDLSDNSTLITYAERMKVCLQQTASEAHSRGLDPDRIGDRDLYQEVEHNATAELARLIQAKADVKQIRLELLAKAEILMAKAEALGFSEHARVLVDASKKFREAVSEVVEFCHKMDTHLRNIGNGKSGTSSPRAIS